MTKTILLSIVMLLHFFCVAQASLNETQIIDSLLDESGIAMREVGIERTIKLSHKALTLSKETGYNLGLIRSYYTIGQALFHNQNYKEAILYLSRADGIKNASNFPLYLSQIYKVKGQIYFYLEMEDKAIREFHRALNVVKDVENSEHRDYLTSQIYESFITVYNYIDENDLAFHYMQKNKALLTSSQNEHFVYPNMINMYGYLGEYYLFQNNADSALQYLNESVKLIEKYDFKYKSRTFMFLGDMYEMKNDYQNALDSYYHALANATELGIKGEFPLLHDKIAHVYQFLNQPDSVNNHLNKKIYFENELLKDKVETTSHALEILLQEELKNSKKKNVSLIILAIVVTTILEVVATHFIWKKRRKVINDELDLKKDELDQKLNIAFDSVMNLAKNNDPAFLVRFQEVYPVFYEKLIEKHPDLTPNELKLCAMTYLNIPTAEIAKYTYVEVRSVQTSRSRLRKKIGVEPDVDLFIYLNSF